MLEKKDYQSSSGLQLRRSPEVLKSKLRNEFGETSLLDEEIELADSGSETG